MRKMMAKALAGWNCFWFNSQNYASAAIFRIGLGSYVLLYFAITFPNWQEFYGPRGIKYWSIFEISLFHLYRSEWFTWLVFVLGLASCVCFIIGFRTRLATILLYLTYASMFHQNILRRCGQESLGTLLLFLACFTPLEKSFSIDALLSRKRAQKDSAINQTGDEDAASLWGLRLIQVTVAILYFFAGTTKLFDEPWRQGTAMYYVSLDYQWFRYPDADFLHSLAISWIMTYGTLVIEIAFPFLVWFKSLRIPVLCSTALLHLGVMLLLAPSIFYFNLFMEFALLSFIPAAFAQRLIAFVTRAWHRVIAARSVRA